MFYYCYSWKCILKLTHKQNLHDFTSLIHVSAALSKLVATETVNLFQLNVTPQYDLIVKLALNNIFGETTLLILILEIESTL